MRRRLKAAMTPERHQSKTASFHDGSSNHGELSTAIPIRMKWIMRPYEH